MALTLRPGTERGSTHIGWLNSRHTFSFGEYHDPRHMGFRSLRVINDDIVAPGAGFGTHGHRDMEIITIVLAGTLEHTDSLGHGDVLRPGEVQVMSAGRGIRHSEFNHSQDEPVHFLQIWIVPAPVGIPPAYAQRAFAAEARTNRLCRVAGAVSGSAGVPHADGALPINQDAHVYHAVLEPGRSARHGLAPGRAAWVHAIAGPLIVNGQSLNAGDAVALEGEAELALGTAHSAAECVVFDLA